MCERSGIFSVQLDAACVRNRLDVCRRELPLIQNTNQSKLVCVGHIALHCWVVCVWNDGSAARINRTIVSSSAGSQGLAHSVFTWIHKTLAWTAQGSTNDANRWLTNSNHVCTWVLCVSFFAVWIHNREDTWVLPLFSFCGWWPTYSLLAIIHRVGFALYNLFKKKKKILYCSHGWMLNMWWEAFINKNPSSFVFSWQTISCCSDISEHHSAALK